MTVAARRRLGIGGTLAIALIAIIALIGIRTAMGSGPATPAEIRAAIAAAPPTCRRYVAARIAGTLATRGTLSRTMLEAVSRPDCAIAAGQYDAVMDAMIPAETPAASPDASEVEPLDGIAPSGD